MNQTNLPALAVIFAMMALIGVIACSIFQGENTVNPSTVQYCAVLAQECVENMKAAQGDPELTATVSAQCVVDWNTAGCSDLLADLTGGKGTK